MTLVLPIAELGLELGDSFSRCSLSFSRRSYQGLAEWVLGKAQHVAERGVAPNAPVQTERVAEQCVLAVQVAFD